MNTLFKSLFFLLLVVTKVEAYMSHQAAPIFKEWIEENLEPFNELMITWNAHRPVEGQFHFYVSVKTENWSPWLLYASWGSKGQSSFSHTFEESRVKVYQDALEVLDGKKATGFQIKIVCEGSSTLSEIHSLHVYTNGDRSKASTDINPSLLSLYLNVPGISQMTLDHVRHKDLCSPTSSSDALSCK